MELRQLGPLPQPHKDRLQGLGAAAAAFERGHDLGTGILGLVVVGGVIKSAVNCHGQTNGSAESCAESFGRTPSFSFMVRRSVD
ncbi:hypothetical protein K466DRAFT_285362 [Polyporus arcularius HHB13444]|uniref:Uncharacterized protein n=1 Tax=Polyporus arcularius HHB13444 TaxID=1314778 RepID=A0A5C3P2H4_9APHY|nr:hypothetical protein K466DRAFT_285362 [Polyporus arcularius HHB13444]